ncbi:MAG: hypothetical protein ACI90V_010783, partial [Bacillariaceae sp.]
MRRANKNNNKKKNNKRPAVPLPPGDDVIAGRTRRQKRTIIASKWNNLLTSIKIEIIGWLDQDSLMDLSLVSKQLHNIICNEPGNKNKIIPVFEVSGSCSPLKLLKNLREYSLNSETKNKLQRYQVMRFKDVEKLVYNGASFDLLKQIMENLQMNGITSLCISSTKRCTNFLLTRMVAEILPCLHEVDFANVDADKFTLRNFSRQCPLLEKVTLHDTVGIMLDGTDMSSSINLKEVDMDNSVFYYYYCDQQKDNMLDLNNHQEIFIFHHCCKMLERISIKNAKFEDFMVDDHVVTIPQNALIKFVRNAPPTLRWFRSDLTS